jgi:hypothetical protein
MSDMPKLPELRGCMVREDANGNICLTHLIHARRGKVLADMAQGIELA